MKDVGKGNEGKCTGCFSGSVLERWKMDEIDCYTQFFEKKCTKKFIAENGKLNFYALRSFTKEVQKMNNKKWKN